MTGIQKGQQSVNTQFGDNRREGSPRRQDQEEQESNSRKLLKIQQAAHMPRNTELGSIQAGTAKDPILIESLSDSSEYEQLGKRERRNQKEKEAGYTHIKIEDTSGDREVPNHSTPTRIPIRAATTISLVMIRDI